jgi:3-hydroxyisobutyrate dehydrogenase-like beta-hydroxyacid dehydrogenase
MKVGFLGLGQMGVGMAANLVKAGHDVTVYNRTKGKAAALTEQGATEAAAIADACRGDAVLTMVADDNALESIAFAESGIVATLPKNAIHISCSTISVALAERLTEAHAKAGQRFISAPVFGRPDAAAAARLAVVVAGPADTLADCTRLFDAIGQRTFILGDHPPIANLIKLSGNFLIASVIETLGEAMALVGKAGVDLHAYLDMLTSTLFAAPVYKTYGNLIANGVFEPAGFAAPLGQKDIRLTLAAAEHLSVPMPVASLLRDRFLTLIATGGETLDWSAIGKLAARDSGQNGGAD